MREWTLVALVSGREIGRVRRDRHDRLSFTYDRQWRAFEDAVPLSISMPLARARHPHDTIYAFLWGLLPDNSATLQGWARDFHVSPRNAFSLLAHVGEECAGAVQFVRPERLDALRPGGQPEVQWLDETRIAAHLRALRADHGATRLPGDIGQFSLAGAQPKTALLRDRGRWGVPAGRTPTTHILKPPTGDLDGHAENEHLCLALARALGLRTVTTEVMRFGDESAIVIERYDRFATSALAAAEAAESAAKAAEAAAWAATADDPASSAKAATAAADAAAASARSQGLAALAKSQPILRLHQEDLCQALGLLPMFKHQRDGGPTPLDIVDLLRAHSSSPEEDVASFVDALAFNWLIAGTDAHAKNYALLHSGGGRVRLAPLYDIASVLPYREIDLQRATLAMKIGGAYRIRDIGPRQWRKLAVELDLDPDATADRALALATALPEQARIVCDRGRKEGLSHPIIGRLEAALVERAQWCRRVLQGKAG